MAIKPELNIAVAGEDIASNEYNENFNKLLEYIEDVSDELILKVNTINSQISTSVMNNLQSVYPVGSIFIGETETCPLASLFGTWEKVGEGILTDIKENIPVVGTGKVLGITTNGNNVYGLTLSEEDRGGAHFSYGRNLALGSYNSNSLPQLIQALNLGDAKALGLSTDPSKSGLAIDLSNLTILNVNIWKRTA